MISTSFYWHDFLQYALSSMISSPSLYLNDDDDLHYSNVDDQLPSDNDDNNNKNNDNSLKASPSFDIVFENPCNPVFTYRMVSLVYEK